MRYAAIAVLMLGVASIDARPRNAPPPQPPPSPTAPAPQRGGRGRAPVAQMTLSSAAWVDGARIPAAHGQRGRDVSPPLTWSGVPEGAASFVLIVHDLDTPVAPGTDDLLHWLVWNIPGSARALPARVPDGATLPDGSRQISATGHSYRGPAAAPSAPPHHYVFELYALDTMLDVPAVGAPPVQTRAAVMAAMAGHVRGKGVFTGTFSHGG